MKDGLVYSLITPAEEGQETDGDQDNDVRDGQVKCYINTAKKKKYHRELHKRQKYYDDPADQETSESMTAAVPHAVCIEWLVCFIHSVNDKGKIDGEEDTE
jgi:hypothetical protein